MQKRVSANYHFACTLCTLQFHFGNFLVNSVHWECASFGWRRIRANVHWPFVSVHWFVRLSDWSFCSFRFFLDSYCLSFCVLTLLSFHSKALVWFFGVFETLISPLMKGDGNRCRRRIHFAASSSSLWLFPRLQLKCRLQLKSMQSAEEQRAMRMHCSRLVGYTSTMNMVKVLNK